MADLAKTMDAVSALNNSHGVTQRGGKKYTQVVHRMEAFRREHGTAFGVDTQVLVDDGQRVVVKAIITDSQTGRIVGSGMAEEIRGQGNVNKTSALENCETSSIGRALASLGLAGGEYASANEIDAVGRKEEAIAGAAKFSPKPPPVPSDSSPPPQPRSADETAMLFNNFLTTLRGDLPELRTMGQWKKYIEQPHVKQNMDRMKNLDMDKYNQAMDLIKRAKNAVNGASNG